MRKESFRKMEERLSEFKERERGRVIGFRWMGGSDGGSNAYRLSFTNVMGFLIRLLVTILLCVEWMH